MSTSGVVGNPLSAGSLATYMASSLPRYGGSIKNPYEAVALAVHAGMLAVGFKLRGLGEDHQIESASSESDPQPLPSEWNASSSYAFRYSHPQSSMEYIIKVGRLGSKAVVDAIATGDDKRTSFDITVKDYVSEGNLPATPVQGAVNEAATNKIQHIFISPGRLSDLGSLLKLNVIQKLAPGIRKEGYEEEFSTAARASRSRDPDDSGEPPLRGPTAPAYDPLRDPLRHDPPARPYPFNDPNAPRSPQGDFPPGLAPPGFEDEYDILRQPGVGRGPARNPLSIGHDDLYPAGLGPRDPLYGSGIRPLGGGGGGSGGMHPTFDDPMFGGGSSGGRYDPQVPGGARYDPIHPGDPRGGLGGFPGGGSGGPFGGGGGGPFGGGRRGGPPNPFGGFGSGDFI